MVPPTTSWVSEFEVCSAITVVEVSKPSVIILPAARVWSETMYWEAEFAVIVLLPITMGAGTAVGAGRGAEKRGWVEGPMII